LPSSNFQSTASLSELAVAALRTHIVPSISLSRVLSRAVFANFAFIAVLTGCGGGGSSETSATNDRPVAQTDMEIAQMLYLDTRRTPQGFYTDDAPPMQGVVATSHLKNADLLGANAQQFELCTDDWNTALAWSDQVATGAQASNLVETNTTARYFEFGRVKPGTPETYVRARVYRCSYLDRSAVDLRTASSVAGQFNQRPLNASELQQLSEYLWQFTSFNNYGNAVLKSSSATATDNVQHTLIIASLTEASTSGGCDRISIAGWTHRTDTQTGALTQTTQTLWSFGARRVAGSVELCTPN
jgi:hypothetical protein